MKKASRSPNLLSLSFTLYIYKCMLLFPSAYCEEANKKKWEEEPMALKASSLWDIYMRFKPHLLMLIAQIGYTLLYFITEASFNHGMDPHVYVTYRNIVAGLFMFPFAFFLERYSLDICNKFTDNSIMLDLQVWFSWSLSWL